MDAVIRAASLCGASAIHPGYGFLSENPDFVDRCNQAGLIWVGPSATAMRALGNKSNAKELAQRLGIPVARAYIGSMQDTEKVLIEAKKIGFPIMIKAAAGGGGRGMRLVHSENELAGAIESARREALASFGSEQILIERAIFNARHIELQVLADSHGQVLCLGERDCSTQRRNQKIIEECPAPGIHPVVRQRLMTAAIQLAKAVQYVGAGTVEFLVEQAADENAKINFLEVNARLQVEHPVTEAILGIDLVEQQLRIAQGQVLTLRQDGINQQLSSGVHAIEARLCAEDPADGFKPQSGSYQEFVTPEASSFTVQHQTGLRIDSGLSKQGEISPFYDSMVAKFIVRADDRATAKRQLRLALNATAIRGLRSNRRLLIDILESSTFDNSERLHTAWLDQWLEEHPTPPTDWPLLAKRATTQWKKSQIERYGELAGFGSLPTSLHWVNACRERFPTALDWETKPLNLSSNINQSADVIWFDHEEVQLSLESSRDLIQTKNAQTESTQSTLLFSRLHGRISAVLVDEGASINAGQILVAIEAMKMEHQLALSKNGVVKKIYVKAGDQVKPGQLLAELFD